MAHTKVRQCGRWLRYLITFLFHTRNIISDFSLRILDAKCTSQMLKSFCIVFWNTSQIDVFTRNHLILM